MHKIDKTYFIYPPRIVFNHLEVLDGHRAPRIFPVAHIRGSTMAANRYDMYKPFLDNIRGGYNPASFADLGKES